MAVASRADVALLVEKFPDSVNLLKEKIGEAYLCVAPDRLVDVVTFLRDEPQTHYDYYVECVGVDYLTWKGERDLDTRFEVVYNLYSTMHLTRLFLKV